MRGKITAALAAAVAAATAAGAAAWAKRRNEEQDAAVAASTGVGQAPSTTASAGAGSAPKAAAAPATDGDDLTVIKGIGAVSAGRLAGIDVTTYAQIAGWNDADVDAVSSEIKVSAERIRHEDWVGQARTLTGA